MKNTPFLLQWALGPAIKIFGFAWVMLIPMQAWSSSAGTPEASIQSEKTAKMERKLERSLKMAKLFFPKRFAIQNDSAGLADGAVVCGIITLVSLWLITSGPFFLVFTPIMALTAFILGKKALKNPDLPKNQRAKAKFGVAVGVAILSIAILSTLLLYVLISGSEH